jgi:eukaryotic-like serine/threonine-protein kinase
LGRAGSLCYHAVVAEARIFNELQRDQVRRGVIVLAWVGAFAGLLVVVGTLSAYLTVRRSVSGQDVQVPDLSGLTAEDATALLKKTGLILEEAAQRNDEALDAGRILAQDPPPGTSIKPQRKVKVVVSLGNKVNSIPELRGGAARKAQITLQQQGMKLGDQVYVYSRRVEENMVIAQDPLPESAGLRDAKVAMLVSRGSPPRAYVMPGLIGRGQTEVLAFLARAGVRVAPLRHDQGSGASPGTVTLQDPEPGYPVHSGDVVTLTVAGGNREGG